MLSKKMICSIQFPDVRKLMVNPFIGLKYLKTLTNKRDLATYRRKIFKNLNKSKGQTT